MERSLLFCLLLLFISSLSAQRYSRHLLDLNGGISGPARGDASVTKLLGVSYQYRPLARSTFSPVVVFTGTRSSYHLESGNFGYGQRDGSSWLFRMSQRATLYDGRASIGASFRRANFDVQFGVGAQYLIGGVASGYQTLEIDGTVAYTDQPIGSNNLSSSYDGTTDDGYRAEIRGRLKALTSLRIGYVVSSRVGVSLSCFRVASTVSEIDSTAPTNCRSFQGCTPPGRQGDFRPSELDRFDVRFGISFSL